jgi:hypothetical protein
LQGTKNTQKITKIPGKFLEIDYDMNNPNKAFGAYKKDFRAFYRNNSGKMRINPRKIRKILGRFWTAPKCAFETFCTQEPLDASA